MAVVDQLALRFLPPGGEAWAIGIGSCCSPVGGDRRDIHVAAAQPMNHLGLVWVLAGQGWLQDGGRRWVLGPGDVFWRVPGRQQSNGSDNRLPWEECFLILPVAMLPVIDAVGRARWPQPVAAIGGDVALRRRWQRLIAGVQLVHAEVPERTVAPILDLALEVLRRVTTGDPERRLVAEACALLDGPAGERLRLPDLARRLGANYHSLRRAFARCTGRGPARWRAERRIERACQLLGDGSSALEVAHILGFPSPQAFHRSFVAVCGIAPGGWIRAAKTSRTPRSAPTGPRRRS